jgi:hypothetical protein
MCMGSVLAGQPAKQANGVNGVGAQADEGDGGTPANTSDKGEWTCCAVILELPSLAAEPKHEP